MSVTTYPEMAQGSEEWHAIRRGIVTASTVGRLIVNEHPEPIEVACNECGTDAGSPCLGKRAPHAPIKTIHEPRRAAAAEMPKRLAVADNETSKGLTATLAAERIAGFTDDTPMTSDMYRGVDLEPYARDVYREHKADVTEIGFMVRDDWGFSIGYSPDGLVGDDGLIEIKAPRTKGHVNTVLSGEVPAIYMPQLQAGLLVSGRDWIDFVPYVPGMALWTIRVTPDPDWQAAIVAAVATFETNAADIVRAYLTATDGLPKTERVDLNALGLVF